MKKLSFLCLVLSFLIGGLFYFTGCTKTNDNESAKSPAINQNNVVPNNLKQLSSDQNTVESTTDQGMNDVGNVLEPSLGKSLWTPDNASIDTTIVGDTIIYTITYHGNNGINTHSRTGQIIIKKHKNIEWSHAGSTVSVTFVNFKDVQLTSNKSVEINGTKQFENVSGGLIRNLGISVTQIIQEIRGALSITFDDSITRTWNIARRRIFTGKYTELRMSITGWGQSGSYEHLDTWGTNRNGEVFYTQITNEISFKIWRCLLDPISGVIVHSIPSDNKKATITFGYNFNNELIPSTSNDCPVKFKLDWIYNGNSGTVFLFI